MNELDETLGRVLHDTAERYRPSEVAAARERFSRRGRRRRVVRAGAAVALVTACVVGVAFLARPEVISGRPIRPAFAGRPSPSVMPRSRWPSTTAPHGSSTGATEP